MSLEILQLEQGSEEWFRARMGIPTASMFQTVLSKGLGGDGEAKGRRTYMLKLIGERLTGEPCEHYSNEHTERGHEQEPQARRDYAFLMDAEPILVGLVRNEVGGFKVGASPDSLLGNDGALELKSKLPHLHLEVLLNQKIPSYHYAQCQGVLWVAEREWIDFMCYCPKIEPFIKRVYRDASFILHLEHEIVQFCEDMARVENLIRSGRIDGPVTTSRKVENPFKADF